MMNNFLEGAISGLGMWVMMTAMGILTFYFLRNRIIKSLAKFWQDVKTEGLQLDGITIEGKLITKKKKKGEKK